MRHPAENFVKYLLLKDGNLASVQDATVFKTLQDWGFLAPQDDYLGLLRQNLDVPSGFDPSNRTHKASVTFLRKHKIYDLFYPNDAVNEAWDILADPEKRLAIEQILMTRMDTKLAVSKLNANKNWLLTKEGVEAFGHFFWNVKLLTFDEWGRYLHGRSSMYSRYVSLLQADPKLVFFHLKIQQVIDSKHMILRAQEIAYFTLEEVSNQPGTEPNKVKAVGVLTKAIVECHEALSTSDMALKDILKQFERFRMEHPLIAPSNIKELAPHGNYSNSGLEPKDKN